MSKPVRKLACAACFFACGLGGDGRGNRKIRFRGQVVPNHVVLKLGQTNGESIHYPSPTGLALWRVAMLRKVSNWPPPQSSSNGSASNRKRPTTAFGHIAKDCWSGTIPRSNRCQQRACRQTVAIPGILGMECREWFFKTSELRRHDKLLIFVDLTETLGQEANGFVYPANPNALCAHGRFSSLDEQPSQVAVVSTWLGTPFYWCLSWRPWPWLPTCWTTGMYFLVFGIVAAYCLSLAWIAIAHRPSHDGHWGRCQGARNCSHGIGCALPTWACLSMPRQGFLRRVRQDYDFWWSIVQPLRLQSRRHGRPCPGRWSCASCCFQETFKPCLLETGSAIRSQAWTAWVAGGMTSIRLHDTISVRAGR